MNDRFSEAESELAARRLEFNFKYSLFFTVFINNKGTALETLSVHQNSDAPIESPGCTIADFGSNTRNFTTFR